MGEQGENNLSQVSQQEDPPACSAGPGALLGNPTPTAIPTSLRTTIDRTSEALRPTSSGETSEERSPVRLRQRGSKSVAHRPTPSGSFYSPVPEYEPLGTPGTPSRNAAFALSEFQLAKPTTEPQDVP